MSWNNLTELYKSKNEIGSHTHTHSHLTKLSDKELDFELRESKRILNPFNCRTLAYPYGVYNSKVIKYAGKYYLAARGFCDKIVNSKDCGYNHLFGGERYKLKVFPTDYAFGSQYPALFLLPFSEYKETVKSIIENKIDNKTWIIFVFHGHYEMNHRSASYNDLGSIRNRLGKRSLMQDIAALTDARQKRVSACANAYVDSNDMVLRFRWMCDYLTSNDHIEINTIIEIVNKYYRYNSFLK